MAVNGRRPIADIDMLQFTFESKGELKSLTDKLQALEKTLKNSAKVECVVGYPKGINGLSTPEAAYDGKASVIEVAIKNNYGLGVPQRAFFDLALIKIEKTYQKALNQYGPLLLQGKADFKKILDLAGRLAEDDVRNSIMDGDWEPNAPATIKAKKSDRPLVDTMTMYRRVTHKVRPTQ